MEWVDRALWVLQGKDNDLHKIAADGTYIGRDKVTGQPDNTSQFRLEGLGFDETTGEFWATAHLTPDGKEKGDYYVSLADIALDTPAVTPAPAPAPDRPTPAEPAPAPAIPVPATPTTPTPPSAVPLPAALPLFGFGLAGLSVFRFKRKQS